MPDAKCKLYDIVEPRPNTVTAAKWLDVYERMSHSGWFGELGQRYGFVYVVTRQDLIGGYFAHEGQKTGIQYDEQKQPEPASAETFEHLFFAIFTDTAQLLLQHRNIYGYTDLGLPVMRERLLRLLGQFLVEEQVRVKGETVRIEPAGIRYSQDELYEFFVSHSVSKLEVKDLRADRIPGEGTTQYNLYNPRDEWNEITWGAVAETLKVGAKNIEIEAEGANAQLNKGPLPKAFARIGEIEEVHARLDDHRVVVRKRTNDEEITVSIPNQPGAVTAILDAVLTRFDSQARVEAWQRRFEQRQQDELRGTMFDPNVQ